MRKLFVAILVSTFVCPQAVHAQMAKSDLKVLYVGGHANVETFATEVDSDLLVKSVAERTAAWTQYLNEYFTQVKAVQGSDYVWTMSNDYDVTIIDGDPMPLEPKRMYRETHGYKVVYAKYFPEHFDRPVITIAEEGETVGRRLGVKTDWYCLCLDRWAHTTRTDHAIFQGPYPVSLQWETRPTPDGAKEYAKLAGETLPETMPMWEVNTKGYSTDKGYNIGMVTRPWGFEDSPDTEYISSGECAKSIDAIALGRHANFFHWGFAGGPDDMTPQAKNVFANVVVYMAQFAGRHIIARKLFETISTREDVRLAHNRYTRATYNDYASSIEDFNVNMKKMADSLKTVKTNGGKLSAMEEAYLSFTGQEVGSYEDYIRRQAGPLFEQFGTDAEAYANYYKENAPYFYGNMQSYGLTIDEDAKSLGIDNHDIRLLEKAVGLWQSGKDVEKAKRLLYRYTLLRYDSPERFASWLEKYKERLFFTESGGWLWLVNDQDPNVEGNDYGVLHFNDAPKAETPKPQVGETTEESPVAMNAFLADADGGKEVVVRVKIHNGYHIYAYVSDKDPFIKTELTITPSDGYELVGDLQTPPFKMLGDNGTTVYEGDIVFRQRIRGGGEGGVKASLYYQACNERACLMPQIIEKELTIR